jgi:hypothetical protein
LERIIELLHQKNRKSAILILIITCILTRGCLCDSGNNSGPDNTVPVKIFGANMAWERLGDRTAIYGVLIRDRSFRCKGDERLIDYRGEYANGGSIFWNTSDPGDINATGGKYYTGLNARLFNCI